MKKLLLMIAVFASSCAQGTTISTVNQSNCHIVKIPRGWKVSSVGSEGSTAVLTKAEPTDKPTSYMVVGAYGHCYNVYEEQ
jgi:hypothetical protein